MIKFTQTSGLVRIWGRKVLAEEATLADVPKIGNLPDAVKQFVEDAKKAEA